MLGMPPGPTKWSITQTHPHRAPYYRDAYLTRNDNRRRADETQQIDRSGVRRLQTRHLHRLREFYLSYRDR